MRTIARMLGVAALLCSALPMLAAAQAKQSKESLQRMYTSYLKGEGYTPEIDKDGDVVFKMEGFTYYIAVDEDDPEFFRVVFTNFWSLNTPEEKQKGPLAANTATRLAKVAKVYVNSRMDNVEASYEILVDNPSDFTRFFRRAVAGIVTARDHFVTEMKKP